MASPAMNDYFNTLAKEHRAHALVTTGDTRLMHRAKADQYERLSGARDLYRNAA